MKRVLIVDDREDNLLLLQILLTGSGYSVEQAMNGEEALERARNQKPDLIITDIFMPVMDGFALCRACKQDAVLKDVPIVFYSATYTDERDREFALSLGAVRFIVKPQEPAVFVKEIREVLASRIFRGVRSLPPSDDTQYLRQYNETLVRKLEERTSGLAAANEALKNRLENLQRLQSAIQESEQRYRLIYESSFDAILLTVPDGRILAANRAACRMFDCTEDELTQAGRSAIADDSDPRLAAALETRRRQGLFHGELTFLRRNGTRFPVEVSSVIFKAPQGEELSCMIVRDMTEQKQTEAALQKQLNELQRWHQAMLGRENRILELKAEVNTLLDRLHLPEKYGISEADL